MHRLEIMKRINDPHNVNERSELMEKCLHRESHLWSHVNINGFKPAYAVNWNSTDASLNAKELNRPPEATVLNERDQEDNLNRSMDMVQPPEEMVPENSQDKVLRNGKIRR